MDIVLCVVACLATCLALGLTFIFTRLFKSSFVTSTPSDPIPSPSQTSHNNNSSMGRKKKSSTSSGTGSTSGKLPSDREGSEGASDCAVRSRVASTNEADPAMTSSATMTSSGTEAGALGGLTKGSSPSPIEEAVSEEGWTNASAKKKKNKKSGVTANGEETETTVSEAEQSKSSNDHVIQLTNQIEILRNQIESERKSSATEISSLRKEIENIKSNTSKGKSPSTDAKLEEKCKRLEAEMATLKEKTKKTSKSGSPQAMDDKDKLLEEKQAAIGGLEADLNRLSKEIEDQREKNNTLRERNWLLVEQLNNKPDGKGGDDKTLKDKLEAATKSEQNSPLDLSPSSQIMERLRGATSQLQKQTEDLTQLNCKLALLQKENSTLTKDKTDLEKRLKKKSPSPAAVNGSINLQAEVDDLKAKNNDLRTKNWEVMEELRKAQSSSSSDQEGRLRARADEAEQECRQLNGRLAKMDSERTRLERVLRETEATLCHLQVAVDEEESKWRENTTKLEKDRNEAQNQLKKATAEIEALRGGNGSELKDRIVDLEKQVMSLTQDKTKLTEEIEKTKGKPGAASTDAPSTVPQASNAPAAHPPSGKSRKKKGGH